MMPGGDGINDRCSVHLVCVDDTQSCSITTCLGWVMVVVDNVREVEFPGWKMMR